MRFANLDGRAVLLIADVDGQDRAVDIHTASGGLFGPSPADCYEQWDTLRQWADDAAPTGDGPNATPVDPTLLGPPSPTPRQSYGIGLNYAAHAAESGATNPTFPPTFTKFPTCITGPYATVALPSNTVDWEVELVVVIGRRAERVLAADAWSHVAGLTIGQDLSDRTVQLRPPVPQFSLGKSFPGFGPTGPWLVTADAVGDPDDLALSCTVNGETMQDSRTSDLIFSVPALVEKLSGITPLLPGDVIFTGTPSGVGVARRPQRFLKPGDVLVTTIESIGSITTNLVAGDPMVENPVIG
jgi:2-keto-4-pentenoate hydratase/2-oxohepta-3-ene-1,7-dioic acid hydratase in catechol pathway